VILLAEPADAGIAQKVREAASEAGLGVLRLVTKSELPGGPAPVLAAAALAEDLAPRTG
jgi:predicted O-linked N-acetylglucosamine transferase (SPINDLY family)